MSQPGKFRNEEPLIREVGSDGSAPAKKLDIFTGTGAAGPSLFGHLRKPDFKPLDNAKPANGNSTAGKSKAKEGSPESKAETHGEKSEHSKPKSDEKSDKAEPEKPQNNAKTHTETPIKEPEKTAPVPAPAAAQSLNIFGKPISDLFKNPAPGLFSGAAPKPAEGGSTSLLFPSAPAPPTGLFGNLGSTAPSTGLFGAPATGAPATGLFAQGSTLFSGSQAGGVAKFQFKGGDSDAGSGDDGPDEPEEAKSESYDEEKARNDPQAWVYDNPYEQLANLKFEDLKVDKKDGIGMGLVALEKPKPKPTSDAPADDKKDDTKAQPTMPLLVVRSRAKVVLSTYMLMQRRSVCSFLKNNKTCVSLIAFQVEKGADGAKKLQDFNVKIKFGDEASAETFKKAFDQLTAAAAPEKSATNEPASDAKK